MGTQDNTPLLGEASQPSANPERLAAFLVGKLLSQLETVLRRLSRDTIDPTDLFLIGPVLTHTCQNLRTQLTGLSNVTEPTKMELAANAIDATLQQIANLKDPLSSGPRSLSLSQATLRTQSAGDQPENAGDNLGAPIGFDFGLPRGFEASGGIIAACSVTIKHVKQLLSPDKQLLGLWRRLGSALADYQNELDNCAVDVSEATLPLPRAVVWQAERLLCVPSESIPALNRLTRFDPTDVVHFLEQVLVCRLRTSSSVTPLSMVASGIAELSRSIANDLRTIEGLAIVEDAYLGITLDLRQRTASRLVDAMGEGENANQMRYVEFKGKDLPLALFTKLYELRGDILENEGDELRSIANAHGIVDKVTPQWRDENYSALNDLLVPIGVHAHSVRGVGRKLVHGLTPKRVNLSGGPA